jgi:hypothetical protein
VQFGYTILLGHRIFEDQLLVNGQNVDFITEDDQGEGYTELIEDYLQPKERQIDKLTTKQFMDKMRQRNEKTT